MVAMLSTAPGRSSASWVRSSGRSAGTPRRTPMQAISAIGALTTSSHSHRTWASAVPPSSGPRTNPDMPTTIIRVMARIRSALSSKSRKTSELVIGAIAAAAMPSPARRAISSPARADTKTTHQAQQAEHGEPDQQHPPTSEPVGDRPGGEQQAAEGQRVRAGDPLQRGRAAAEVATDRGQRDRQQRVVDHLDEERQAQRGERDPRRAQGRVGARRSRGGGDGGHGADARTARFHPGCTALSRAFAVEAGRPRRVTRGQATRRRPTPTCRRRSGGPASVRSPVA